MTDIIGTRNGVTYTVGNSAGSTPAPAPAPTKTTTPTASGGGSSTPKVPSYSDLVNKNGTIYQTSTGVGFATPQELASHLGISADQINWNSIPSNPNYTPPKTTPAPTTQPGTPAPGTGTPISSKVSYADLVNNNGTIYNSRTGQGYSTPAELAGALGVSVDQINWQGIKTGAVPVAQPATLPVTPPATPLPTPQATPAASQPGQAQGGQSFTDVLASLYNSRPDLQALYNPDGSAKNPNDPAIAGIPTLQDWGNKYGVNESPQLAAAQTSQTPSLDANGQSTQTDAKGNPVTKPTTGVAENPIDHVNNIYKQVYEKLGISALKTTIDDYNKQLLDLRNAKTDDVANINNNPWLTEGIRVTQISKLDDKYGQKEANLLAYLQMSTSLYNTGLSEANAMVNDVNQLEASNAQYAHDLATSNAKHEQDLVDARYKLASGMPFYKYPGTALVYSTATGTGVNYDQYIALGGDPGFGNVAEIKPPGSTNEQTLVIDLAKKYPDAGIIPSDSLVIAQQKQAMSPLYLKSIMGTTVRRSSGSGSGSSSGGGSGGGGGTKTSSSGIRVTAPPKTLTANSVRTWLLANYHKYAGKAYYDIWGAAADAIRNAGGDPNTYDKTFWNVFRPGEYDTYHPKKGSSGSSGSSYDNL
jgi:hypothetical protein